jgi:glutathione synthase/RimK-type ligase-like ATP-grasp enzyme
MVLFIEPNLKYFCHGSNHILDITLFIKMKLAFITYQIQEKYTSGTAYDEDAELLRFLKQKGIHIEQEIWNDPDVEWTQYDLAIIKSPWDYHEHINEFYLWLEQIRSLGVQLLNSTDIVKWNSDKHYLKEIADAGLNVIPTLFLEKGTTPDISVLFLKLKTEQLIIKPCVSAGAKNTWNIRIDTVETYRDEIYELLKDESYMAQPFMPEIVDGEWSYLFFNGRFSHSLLKKPAKGDFRVQHYHGGTISKVTASPEQIKSAGLYVEKFATDTLYARVDGVHRDGELYLMELELIEPYLFLNTDPEAFQNYYVALTEIISKNGKQ